LGTTPVGADQAGNAFYRSLISGRSGATSGYVRGFDDVSKTPYLVGTNDITGEMAIWTYEDIESLWWKGNFIREHGFGGEIVWDLSGDHNGSLKQYIFNLLEAGIEGDYVQPADEFIGC